MFILGITGGVGSGKSRVLQELESEYGAFVVEADKLAHELMLPGNIIYKNIVDCFGIGILETEEPHYIDRKKLGDIVFNDMAKLKQLNDISHPLVKRNIMKLIDEHNSKNTKLFVIEAAILIEAGYKDICDEIWYIWVEVEERIRRLMESRAYTREKCLSIINNQKTDDFYKVYANCTIDNSKSFEHTVNQLKHLLNNLYYDDIIS